jgi:hypothetical protein
VVPLDITGQPEAILAEIKKLARCVRDLQAAAVAPGTAA